jgi:hypothetical protein
MHLHSFFLKSHYPITSSILGFVDFFATLALLSIFHVIINFAVGANIPFVRSNQSLHPLECVIVNFCFPGGIISAQYVFSKFLFFDGNFGHSFILFRLYHFGHGLLQAEVMKSIDQIMEVKVQVHFISMFSHGVENVAAFLFSLQKKIIHFSDHVS